MISPQINSLALGSQMPRLPANGFKDQEWKFCCNKEYKHQSRFATNLKIYVGSLPAIKELEII